MVVTTQFAAAAGTLYREVRKGRTDRAHDQQSIAADT